MQMSLCSYFYFIRIVSYVYKYNRILGVKFSPVPPPPFTFVKTFVGVGFMRGGLKKISDRRNLKTFLGVGFAISRLKRCQ